jgi:CBS domain-containing protein
MKAGQLCSQDMAVATPDDSMMVAARRMAERDVRELVVVEDLMGYAHPVGIVTDHDLVRALARDTRPEMLAIRSLMRTDVVAVHEDADVDAIYEEMARSGEASVPVVDHDDHVQGVVALDRLVALRRSPWSMVRAVGGGIAAGVFAGLMLAALIAITNAVQGHDVWLGLKRAGIPFLGDRAVMPGFDSHAVLVGLGAHLLVAVCWGVAFALMVYGYSRPATVVAGAVWGLVVWFGMFYVVLPNLGLVATLPLRQAIATHVVFGALLGIGFLRYQRVLPKARG